MLIFLIVYGAVHELGSHLLKQHNLEWLCQDIHRHVLSETINHPHFPIVYSTLDISHLNCTVQSYFWCTRLRPDARGVSKARLLSQALRYPEVEDLSHQCLSAGLLVPMQDWAFEGRCLALDRPNMSNSLGLRAILCGTPCLECSQSRSFNSLIKFHFGATSKTLSQLS
jgi:hypothetical protein